MRLRSRSAPPTRPLSDYPVADVTYRGPTFEIAELYRQLGKDLMSSRRPKNLKKDELEQYDVFLARGGRPSRSREGHQLHEDQRRANQNGREGRRERGALLKRIEWVQNKLRGARAAVNPGRYGKVKSVKQKQVESFVSRRRNRAARRLSQISAPSKARAHDLRRRQWPQPRLEHTTQTRAISTLPLRPRQRPESFRVARANTGNPSPARPCSRCLLSSIGAAWPFPEPVSMPPRCLSQTYSPDALHLVSRGPQQPTRNSIFQATLVAYPRSLSGPPIKSWAAVACMIVRLTDAEVHSRPRSSLTPADSVAGR